MWDSSISIFYGAWVLEHEKNKTTPEPLLMVAGVACFALAL